MWDLPGSGLEPTCPALTGGFLTTAPPGKSQETILIFLHILPFPDYLFKDVCITKIKLMSSLTAKGRLTTLLEERDSIFFQSKEQTYLSFSIIKAVHSSGAKYSAC